MIRVTRTFNAKPEKEQDLINVLKDIRGYAHTQGVESRIFREPWGPGGVIHLHNDKRQKEPTSRLFGYPSSPRGDSVRDPARELLLSIESYFQRGRCFMNFWDAGSMTITTKRRPLARGTLTGIKTTVFSC